MKWSWHSYAMLSTASWSCRVFCFLEEWSCSFPSLYSEDG